MDKNKMKREIYAANFRVNNGKVMRAINLLRTEYIKLVGVESAVEGIGVEHWEFIDCVNYLSQAGYIHLRYTGSKVSATLADCDDHAALEAIVTAKGIQLLAGGIKDPVVEV